MSIFLQTISVANLDLFFTVDNNKTWCGSKMTDGPTRCAAIKYKEPSQRGSILQYSGYLLTKPEVTKVDSGRAGVCVWSLAFLSLEGWEHINKWAHERDTQFFFFFFKSSPPSTKQLFLPVLDHGAGRSPGNVPVLSLLNTSNN